MPTSAKRHSIIAIHDDTRDWENVTWHVDCPHDRNDPSRDCKMVDGDGGGPYPGCGLEHWLMEGGPETIRVVGDTGSWFPIHGHVQWDDDGPMLVLP